jgi:hypothetical protein
VFFGFEILRHKLRCFQAAIKPVSPTVIGTGQAFLFAFLLKAKQRTAVPANVEKGINLELSVTDNDDGFLSDLKNKELPCVRNPAAMIDQHPFASDNFLHVQRKHIVITVKRLRSGRFPSCCLSDRVELVVGVHVSIFNLES